MSFRKAFTKSMLLSIYISLLLTSLVLAQTESLENETLSALGERGLKLPRNFPIRWWIKYGNKSEQWYRSEEGTRIANNIISWQTPEGGWPLMNTTNEPWTGDEKAIGPWGRNGTFIGSTTNEIRFLSKAFLATQDGKYKQAVLKGIQYIFDAQTPTGGWPKAYPLKGNDYKQHITFNDGAIVNVLTLMREMVTNDQYAFLESTLRDQIKQKYDLGIDCILKCQIVTNSKLTAWCQQHDKNNYHPRPGRTFEPAAISASESIGIIKLLMQIENPSPKVQQAIESAVNWINASKIEGYKVITVPDPDYALKGIDRKLVPDPNSTIWARNYFNELLKKTPQDIMKLKQIGPYF